MGAGSSVSNNMDRAVDQNTKPKLAPSKSKSQITSNNKQPVPDISARTSEDDKTALEELIKNNPEHLKNFQFFDRTTTSMKDANANPMVLAGLCEECELLFFNSSVTKYHKMIGDYFALTGFVEATSKKYVSLMKLGNLEFLTDEMFDSDELFEREPENDDIESVAEQNGLTKYQKRLLFIIRNIFWNFSDSSVVFGESVAKTGFFHYVIKDLEYLKQRIVDNKLHTSDIFESSVGILHNCGKSCSAETLECYRKEDVVKHMVPFLKTKNTNIKVLVLLTLSNIINEEENNLLLADNSVFQTLIQLIELAKKNSNHRYDGFSVEELVSGLKGLAKNDQNKPILMSKGVLPLLKDIIETQVDDGEVLQATDAIRVLSFSKDIKENIKNDPELMKLITDLTKSSVEIIVKAAQGILWNLKDHDKEKTKIISSNSGGHVMISYQWADQKKLIQIQQSLTRNGYSVWMDINDMEGSTLQAMADAVEQASVVLICMSERYKLSSNCRTEAEYAFTLKKNIIPLMMQRSYKPDGWLGMILGAKLFCDFSGKYAYDDMINKLMKQLGDEGRLQETISDSVDGPIVAVKAVPLQVAKGNSINDWSKADVAKWILKLKLQSNKSLQSVSGEHLHFLKKLSNRAPEFFFSFIKTDLGLSQLDDMMKFSNAIDQL